MARAIEKEAVVEAYLVQRVEAAGGLALKVVALGQRGFFDRLVVLPGRVLFVEIKRPKGGIVSPQQRALHEKFRQLGAEIAVVKNRAGVDSLINLSYGEPLGTRTAPKGPSAPLEFPKL